MIWPIGGIFFFKSIMARPDKRKFWSIVWYSTSVQNWELIGLNIFFFFLVSTWRASLSDGNSWQDTSSSLIPSADVPRKIIFLFLMGRGVVYQNTCTLESGFYDSRSSKAFVSSQRGSWLLVNSIWPVLPPYHPTSFSREHLVPQIESTIVEGRALAQEIWKHNALAPFDNIRSLSACGPFGGFFFLLYAAF